MATEILTGAAALANRFDAFVLDLWGTLHDGVSPLPRAVDCLERLHATGCRIAILSNAPRRAKDVEQGMHRIGIPAGRYHHVFSSGEEAWQAIAERADPWYRSLGRRCFHIGPERDGNMLDNPGLDPVSEVEDAEFVLCTGLDHRDQTVADYAPCLAAAAERDLPLVCANPDLEVLRGGLRELCAGSLAAHYEDDLGGTVRWHGKPHPSVLLTCLTALGGIEPRRAAMVGDALRTDVAGAAATGMTSVFLSSGIHAEQLGADFGVQADPDRLASLFEAAGRTPDVTLPAFTW